jgi:FkbM family methyltransferase
MRFAVEVEMTKLGREVRRVMAQIGDVVRHGQLNPFPRTERRAKPRILRAHPDWEIQSSLEFMATHALKDHGDFFFVQIGAFDGEFDDPIAHLVRTYGWQGVLVEPQPAAFERLRQNYADQRQLKFENVAIGENDGDVALYSLRGQATHLASFQRQHLLRHATRPADIIEQKVTCITLNTLLQKHNLPRVDLLLMDAEGFDARLLHSIDFDTFTPTIVRYEHSNLLNRERCQCIELLSSHGYRILLEDCDTIAYHSDECAGL